MPRSTEEKADRSFSTDGNAIRYTLRLSFAIDAEGRRDGESGVDFLGRMIDLAIEHGLEAEAERVLTTARANRARWSQ